MTNTLRALAVAAVAALGLAQPASAAVIGFEDISAQNALGKAPPAGYQGFAWSAGVGNWAISYETENNFSGTEAHGGNVYAWSGATPLFLDVFGGGTFDLDSLWLRSGQDSPFNVTVYGYAGGQQKYSKQLQLTTSYSFADLNFDGITEFKLATTGNVLVDDIDATIRTQSVPEPTTLALLGLALAGAAAGRRKRL